uniref:Cytochrome P450 n=1 Tax=Plectus sambesii TaxID=2011161 RepID=A0A914W0P9_9BILA
MAGWLLLLIAFTVFALWRWLTNKEVRDGPKLPPSPYGKIPLLGHLWRLNATKPFATIDAWSQQLGDVFSIYFGTDRVIVLSRNRVLKEAFLQQAANFSGRPDLFVHRSCWGVGHVISEGPVNVETRKFLLTVMREGGVSSGLNAHIQTRVDAEVGIMLNSIDEKLANGECDLDIEDTTFFVVGNVLTSMVLGRTYPHNSDEFRQNSAWLAKTTELMHRSSALTFLPWLRFAPPSGFGYWEMKRQAKAVNQMMTKDIENRIRTQEYKDVNKIDLTSAFLRKIDDVTQNKGRKQEVESKCYTTTKLARIMTEMFFAGIQTECNTFGWAFLYLIEHPDVQEKCRQQIWDEMGRDRRPQWEDRLKIPYLEAMVHEVQRCANIAPFAIFHKTFKDTVLDGYLVPANSMIMMNLWSTLRDPEYFPCPEEFRPERFLDEFGAVKERLESLLPYGIGSRICMGESLARIELFVIIGALLQRYRFYKIPGVQYSLEQNMELTIHAAKYKLRVEKL